MAMRMEHRFPVLGSELRADRFALVITDTKGLSVHCNLTRSVKGKSHCLN